MKPFSEYISEEYIHEMSRSDKDEFRSLIKNLLSNHVQIQFVGGRDVNHWQKEMRACEDTLFRLIKEVPGLKSETVPLLRDKYPNVKFPIACPFALQHVVGHRVWNELQPRLSD